MKTLILFSSLFILYSCKQSAKNVPNSFVAQQINTLDRSFQDSLIKRLIKEDNLQLYKMNNLGPEYLELSNDFEEDMLCFFEDTLKLNAHKLFPVTKKESKFMYKNIDDKYVAHVFKSSNTDIIYGITENFLHVRAIYSTQLLGDNYRNENYKNGFCTDMKELDSLQKTTVNKDYKTMIDSLLFYCQ